MSIVQWFVKHVYYNFAEIYNIVPFFGTNGLCMEVFIALLFAVGVTLPNILLLGLGRWLRRTGKVDEAFCQKASQVVFQWSLPMLLLSNIIGKPVHFAAQGRLVLAGLLTTFLLYALAEAFAHFHIPQPADKGVFVQGVFRSNLGIIGLAFVQNAYGGDGLANSAVYMGIITIELNILAVLTLSRTKQASWRQKLADTARKIATNPLIAAIVLAMCLNELPWSVPEPLLQTARYLGHLALPLALLCAGATFHWQTAKKWSDVSVLSSIGRLVVAPLMAVLVGKCFGLQGMDMGILFLMTATPVAAASYVMAKAMGGNDVAAANIMGITTVGAMLSAGLGMTVLRLLGWM